MKLSVLVVLPVASGLLAPSATTRRSGFSALHAGHVGRDEHPGGLGYVELKHDSGASAKIYPFGADVCSFIDKDGTEWIAVRPDAKMDGSKPISGGLSHCFPQFGPGEIQQHGFARNVEWKISDWNEATDSASVTFTLKPSKYTIEMWDKPFEADFMVKLNANSLDTKMTVKNTGAKGSFDFQAALHSYFDISSITDCEIRGSFAGKPFLNKAVSPPKEEKETRSAITIDSEYDRVYMGTNDPIIVDPGKKKKLAVKNTSGWKDTVLWSPFGNEGMGYQTFVCVESVAFDKVEVPAGGEWVGEMSLVPEPI